MTDLGKFAIHTTRKRLIQVQRERRAKDETFRAFEVLNLGRYERQVYLNISGRLTGKKKEQALARKEQEFRDLILKAYRAEPLPESGFFPRKGPARASWSSARSIFLSAALRRGGHHRVPQASAPRASTSWRSSLRWASFPPS